MSVSVKCEILADSTKGDLSHCNTAYDCRGCDILRRWERQLEVEGFSTSWECADCISIKEVKRFLTAYYTECECSRCHKHTIVGQMVVYERER